MPQFNFYAKFVGNVLKIYVILHKCSIAQETILSEFGHISKRLPVQKVKETAARKENPFLVSALVINIS